MSADSRCSKCGSVLEAGDMFCGECGARAGAPGQSPPQPGAPSAASCPACGASARPGWQFCDKCGAALAGQATTALQFQPGPLTYQAPPPPLPGSVPPGYGQYVPPPHAAQLAHNTSGMGSAYPVPPDASGISCAGAVPLGLFAFLNGMTGLGILGVFSFIPLIGLIYFLIITFTGKAGAWRNRRFNDSHEYQATMRAWHGWGIFFVILNVLGYIAYFIMVFVLSASGDSAGGIFDY